MTEDTFNKMVEKFDAEHGGEETALNFLFSLPDDYDDKRLFFARVYLLNAIYHTRLSTADANTIANALAIDISTHKSIREKNDVIKAHNAIVNINGLSKKPYSFASKYCSFCNPDKFPIMDGYARAMLYLLTGESINYDNYEQYVDTINKLRENEDYPLFKGKDYKTLDKFLWQYAKENNYTMD